MDTTKKQRKTKKTTVVPPTGIPESGKSICIMCPLQGIPEEKIWIDLDQTLLTISAAKNDGGIMREIKVPAGSWISNKKFHDGILEIVLEQPR